MSITAHAVPILSDNYAWLLRDDASGAVAIVDPADPEPIIAAIEQQAGGRLDLILLTHHHADHVAGTDAVRARFGAPVVGAAADARRLPKLDRAVREGDSVALGGAAAAVIDTPGHTIGHIAFHFPDGGVLLCGDTLFSLGCGRLIEGTAADMFASLGKFARLPGGTLACCGHEYTQSNARFALTVEPDNAALKARAAEVDRLRAEGRATVPSTIAAELAENPFMRAPDVARLAEIRTRKDKF
jgi:hydroxyacylglutathione hydrolase